MTEQNSLLFELGTEELPPKTLFRLSDALATGIRRELEMANLGFGGCFAYATPRRLAVIVENLDSAQPNKTQVKRGPSIKAAFTADGNPSKAAEGFAKSCNTSFDQLGRFKTEKGEWLTYTQDIKGRSIVDLIPEIIRTCVNTLPVAKKMRWGSYNTEFVRPVHWAVLMYGQQLIKTKVLNIETGNQTYGHRFLAPKAITLDYPGEYLDKLYYEGNVVADSVTRKELIRESAIKAAEEISGIAFIDDELLDEITALNEWPVPITGSFDKRFLELPSEVLITTMQINQKYFPVHDKNNKLLPNFITISNIKSSHPESIQKGNERVIKPRLSDAEFFWNKDKTQSLKDRASALAEVIFQKKLGTLADKTHRTVLLSDYLSSALNTDAEIARRAALLSKTDLLTEMVGEFPALQGIMGRYYAVSDGEPEAVALALEEQYFPRHSGGKLPDTVYGQILSMAEKIDTVAGIFSIGLRPTGDKDPYALRRATLGILRIIIEKKLNINIIELLETALCQFSHEFDREITRQQIINYIFERLKGYYIEQGYKVSEFDAVFSVFPESPLDFDMRLKAVKEFRRLPEAESLASANKRIRNILKKSDVDASLNFKHLVEPEEKKLWKSASQASEAIKPLLSDREYFSALYQLAQLRIDVDAFFDNVMVMTDNLDLRANRLGLLTFLSDQFLQIADISRLQS